MNSAIENHKFFYFFSWQFVKTVVKYNHSISVSDILIQAISAKVTQLLKLDLIVDAGLRAPVCTEVTQKGGW